jgi:hypothetical protein
MLYPLWDYCLIYKFQYYVTSWLWFCQFNDEFLVLAIVRFFKNPLQHEILQVVYVYYQRIWIILIWIILCCYYQVVSLPLYNHFLSVCSWPHTFVERELIRQLCLLCIEHYTIIDPLPYWPENQILTEAKPRTISDFLVNNIAYSTGNRSITVLLYNKIHVLVNQ